MVLLPVSGTECSVSGSHLLAVQVKPVPSRLHLLPPACFGAFSDLRSLLFQLPFPSHRGMFGSWFKHPPLDPGSLLTPSSLPVLFTPLLIQPPAPRRLPLSPGSWLLPEQQWSPAGQAATGLRPLLTPSPPPRAVLLTEWVPAAHGSLSSTSPGLSARFFRWGLGPAQAANQTGTHYQ